MMIKSVSIIGLIFFLLPLLTSAATEKKGETGEWEPININDVHIQDLAKFAVEEYNKQSASDLKFQAVVGGYQQVVAGMNYRLVIAAEEDGSGKYEAVVWEKEWEHSQKLISFKRLLEN